MVNGTNRLLRVLLLLAFVMAAVGSAYANPSDAVGGTPNLKALFERSMRGETLTAAEKRMVAPMIRAWEREHAGISAIDASGGPDAFGYSWKDNNGEPTGPVYNWYDISSTGTTIPYTNYDDGMTNIPIGFTYKFYDVNYSTVNVGTNGFVSFTSTATAAGNATIPTAAVPNAVIAPFWDDLLLDTDPFWVKYQNVGTDTLVVSWYTIHFDYVTDTLRFQLLLTSSGDAIAQYNTITVTDTAYATIGIEDQNGTIGLQVAYNNLYAVNGRAIRFTAPCNYAVNVSPANSATNQMINVPLTWHGGSCTTNYDVYLGTDSAQVAAGNILYRVVNGSPLTSYTPALRQGFVYYWKVVAYDGSGNTRSGPVWTFATYLPVQSGTKYLGGATPDYLDFADAARCISVGGLGTGGVTVYCRPGTYGRATFPVIANASSDRQIRFLKESGTVTIADTGTSLDNEFLLKLNGADYITFDGIDLLDNTTTSASVEFGLWVTNFSASDGAQYNSFKNASITMRRDNANSKAIYQYNIGGTVPTGANSYNKYLNLKIRNSRNGVYLVGQGTVGLADYGTEIGSSTTNVSDANRFEIGAGGVDDIGGASASNGIYVNGQQNYTIHDIDIHNVSTIGSTQGAYGIYFSTAFGTNLCYNNRIYDIKNSNTGTANGTAYGAFSLMGNGPELRFYNNMIWGVRSTSVRTAAVVTVYVYGFYVSSGTVYTDNNSFLIEQQTINPAADTLYNSVALYMGGGINYVRNNVLYNKSANQTTSKHYAIYKGASATLVASDYNVFYVPNTVNGFVGNWGGTDAIDLAAWRTASLLDANSVVGDPRYINEASNLHITAGVGSPVSNEGTYVAWVTADIDGNARNTSFPDAGADEGDFGSATLPDVAQLNVPLNNSLGNASNPLLSWTAGLRTTNVDVYLSSIPDDVTNLVAGAMVASATTATSYTASSLVPGIRYYWRVVSRNASGTTVSPVWAFLVGLSGTKTIGGVNPDYATFPLAVAALASVGVAPGGVTFNARNGVYTDSVRVPEIAGASETAQIVFQKENAADSVVFSVVGTAGGTDYCWKLHAADWITINGYKFVDGGTSSANFTEYGVWLTNINNTNGSQHNTIKNCTASMTASNVNSRGFIVSVAIVPISLAGTNSYNKLLNLKVAKARAGIFLSGYQYYSVADYGNEIGSEVAGLDNTNRLTIGGVYPDSIFGNSTSAIGIYAYGQENVYIHDCDIKSIYAYTSLTNNAYSCYGIWGTYLFGNNNVITRNRISGIKTSTAMTTATGSTYGIIALPQGNTTVYITNNFVSDLFNASALTIRYAYFCMYGIRSYTIAGTGTAYIDNNTVHLDQGTPLSSLYSASADICTGTGTSVLNSYVRNNVMSNITVDCDSSNHDGWADFNPTLANVWGNNNLYYFPYTVRSAVSQSTPYGVQRTLAGWQAASGLDANSVEGNPIFVNAVMPNADMHIQATSGSPASNAGVSLAWVGVDIDNQTRSGTMPDMGADEGSFGLPAPTAPTALRASFAPATNTVTLSWTAATGTITGYHIYASSSAYFTPSGTPLASVAADQTTYSYVATGIMYYKVTAYNTSNGLDRVIGEVRPVIKSNNIANSSRIAPVQPAPSSIVAEDVTR